MGFPAGGEGGGGRDGAAGGGECRASQVGDGVAAAGGDLVHLGEFLRAAARLTCGPSASPASPAACFVDAGGQVVAYLGQPRAAGRGRGAAAAADGPLTEPAERPVWAPSEVNGQ